MQRTVRHYFDFNNPEDVDLVREILGGSDIEDDPEADDEMLRIDQPEPSIRVGADEVRHDDEIEDVVTVDEDPQPDILVIEEAPDSLDSKLNHSQPKDAELHNAEPRVSVQLRPRLQDLPSTSRENESSFGSGDMNFSISSNVEPTILQSYFHNMVNAPGGRKTQRPVKWLKRSILPEEGAFANAEVPNIVTQSVGSPLDYFRKYIPLELLEKTAFFTNLYALQQETNNFPPTNASELEQFIGLHLVMGSLPFPRVNLFYDTTLKIGVFPQTMSRDRLFQLRTNLHFVNNMEIPPNNRDRFFKVRPLYDSIRSVLLQFPLEENLAIDEQIIPFRGKLNVKQYVKGKPCPWGVKVFFLCGKSGLPYDFIIYQGEQTEIDPEGKKLLGLGGGMVYTLVKRINDGVKHQLYYDNYFSNFHLLRILKMLGIKAAGTVRINRFFQPPFTSDSQFLKKPRGTSEEFTNDDGDVTIVKWLDNKCVVLASNFVGVGQVDEARRWDKTKKEYIAVDRPEIVREYNRAMGGVDLLDQMISLYRISVRSRKWTVRMFSHAFDLAAVCSWMQYRRDAAAIGTPAKDIMDLLHFRMKLSDQLILQDKGVGNPKKRGRPSKESAKVPIPKKPKSGVEVVPHKEIRLDGMGHLAVHDMKKYNSRCKLESCGERTFIYCQKCNVHLCINASRNCFLDFHSA